MKKYYKVGERFEAKGKELEVVEVKGCICDGCFIYAKKNCWDYACIEEEREDEV